MSLVVSLDFETSGRDPSRNAPVQLGVALMDGQTTVDTREWIIAPHYKNGKITREYNVEALEVSGLTWKQIKEGVPSLQVCREFYEWAHEGGMEELPIIAFNMEFDLSFYNLLFYLAGEWNKHTKSFELPKPALIGPWQCTRNMARDLLALEGNKLDDVAAHFGFSRDSKYHGALSDAVLNGLVYHELREIQEQRRTA